jgi:DNA-3-methyladenine glycosylase
MGKRVLPKVQPGDSLPPPLPRAFHARQPAELAQALLGMHLVHAVDGTPRWGRIVETEAYVGPHDLACHSSKGRTARTEVMFGAPGHAYAFLVYGMHVCFNVVTGDGAAVLIRAVEPGPGLALSRTDGPGRLTRALGVGLEVNGKPLDEPPLYLGAGTPVPRSAIARSPRIGVEYAGMWAQRLLRFYDRRSPWVSRTKPVAAARK